MPATYAEQLDYSTTAISSNPYINGILWGGWHWVTPGSSTAMIGIHLAGGGETSSYDSQWTTNEYAAILNALSSWSNVANISFFDTSAANANFIEHSWAANSPLFGNSQGFLGQHGTPDQGSQVQGYYNYGGYGWDWASANGGLQVGGFGYLTLVHELGHGLGLAHPHDTGGGSNIWPGVTNSNSPGTNNQNQDVNTVMSYVHGLTSKPLNGGANADNYGYVAGPMAYDIAAIQLLYGANTTYRSSNDTYVIPASNGLGTYWTCIWDTGGLDQIIYNGSGACTINLNAATLDGSATGGGALSRANGITGGFTIANGVVVEKAIGGFGSDVLIGNAANNVLDGRSGNDALTGGGGSDIFVFGPGYGADTITDFISGLDQIDVSAFSNIYSVNIRSAIHTYSGSALMVDFGVNNIATNATVLTPSDFTFRNGSGGLNINKETTASGIDFDNDGKDALLWRQDDGRVFIWEMNGAQTKSYLDVSALPTDWHLVGSGDFNNDSKSDILLRHDSGQIYLWTMNGGQISASQQVSNLPNDWHIQAVGDFNGDHKSDVLLRNNSGQIYEWTMNGNQVVASQQVSLLPTNWHIFGSADFNGDGKSDVVLRHDSGQIYLWTMNGTQVVSSQQIAVLPNDWRLVSIADFNGDNKSDILLRHIGGQIYEWTMNGAQIVASQQVANLPNEWQIQTVGDFSGDGKADIMLRYATGQVFEWQMNGSQIVSSLPIDVLSTQWHVVQDHHDFFSI